MLHVYVLFIIAVGHSDTMHHIYFDSLEKCEQHAKELKNGIKWGDSPLKTYCWEAVK